MGTVPAAPFGDAGEDQPRWRIDQWISFVVLNLFLTPIVAVIGFIPAMVVGTIGLLLPIILILVAAPLMTGKIVKASNAQLKAPHRAMIILIGCLTAPFPGIFILLAVLASMPDGFALG